MIDLTAVCRTTWSHQSRGRGTQRCRFQSRTGQYCGRRSCDSPVAKPRKNHGRYITAKYQGGSGIHGLAI